MAIAPPPLTLKVLFARSGNRCAFPECAAPIVESSGTVTAEICHIRALSTGGPRYDPAQTPEQRNAVGNLLLMCGRHHKIIDTEVETYTVTELLRMKRVHEQHGVVAIPRDAARVAEQLSANFAPISVTGNSGNIAIQSPGVIQAKTVTIKTTKSRISVVAPPGSIGASCAKTAYCDHLIQRYQEFQKGDWTGKSGDKFMMIHLALKRRFGVQWRLLADSQFADVAAFLQARIDRSALGRINRSKGHANYSAFEAWHGRT